jgi:hypothetical protein
VTGGNFLYLSTVKPAVFPGTTVPDLQAWIRNSNLKPDWLRIGTDIIDGNPAPTFNMTFSLQGETIPDARDARAGELPRPKRICSGQAVWRRTRRRVCSGIFKREGVAGCTEDLLPGITARVWRVSGACA